MPGTTNKVDDPCEECRTKHLKCDDNRPKCSQCERNAQKCCRTKGQRKFRDGSSAQYEKQFAKDQVWLNFSKNANFQIVDQTPEVENFYSTDEHDYEKPKETRRPAGSIDSSSTGPLPLLSEVLSHSPHLQSTTRSDNTLRSPSNLSPTSYDHVLTFPGPKRRRTDDSVIPAEPSRFIQLPPISQELRRPLPIAQSPLNYVPSFSYQSPTEANETRRIEAEYRKIADADAALIPEEPFLTPAKWKRDFRWPNQFTTQQCVCLMRYYIEHLGPWLDVGDPTRQFTSAVPQRARRSPALLNAIFSAAAQHLRYVSDQKQPGRVVHYGGFVLESLNEISNIKYYTATNAYLRVLCTKEEYVKDEDLLAATVIIRFYQELDNMISGTSHDELTRPFQLFVAAQARPALNLPFPYEQYDFRIPGAFAEVRYLVEPYLKSYQHASFRIALRQECSRALLTRQEIQLPLQAWKLLDGFDEADDSTWTDRHLYHYANVLQFCFANHESGSLRASRWQELRNFAAQWEAARPLSFSHYHRKEPVREKGEVFPQMWFIHEVNAAGMLYYHFARILLIVYDPTIHKIGPGSAAAQRKISEDVREIVIQLCGVAMSSVQTQPILVQAYNAIAMFGEHFTDRLEQEALLGVLRTLEEKHGWPVWKDAVILQQEWGWE